MSVLGVDPGSRNIGFALIEGDRKNISHLTSGVLKFDSIPDPFLRLKEIFKSIRKLVLELRPDEVAIESLVYKKNPATLITLAQARGAILTGIMQDYTGSIFEYSPNLIKSTTTGYGFSSKKSIEKGIGFIIGDKKYSTHDESDAVAVAICHIFNRGVSLQNAGGPDLKNRLSHSWFNGRGP